MRKFQTWVTAARAGTTMEDRITGFLDSLVGFLDSLVGSTEDWQADPAGWDCQPRPSCILHRFGFGFS